jgi:hypothetical protein
MTLTTERLHIDVRAVEEDLCWIAREAELAADATMRRLFGPDTAELVEWTGRADGSATGDIEGVLLFRWSAPNRWGPERVGLQRSCALTGDRWQVELSGWGDLIREVENWCPCGEVST